MKRGDTCRRPRHARNNEQASSIPLPISPGKDGLNIEQLKLFHHFQTSTCHTLPMVSQFWEHVIPMAFEHKYLMHAALCCAARHLDFLYPDGERENLNLSRRHLSHALNLYRAALADPITDENQDPILCTSLFLYFEAWSDPEILPMDGSISYNISKDQLYTFSKGMKHVCSLAIPPTAGKLPILHDMMRYRPIHAIQTVLSAVGRDCYGYQGFFEELYNQEGPVVSERFRELPEPVNAQICNTLQPDIRASDAYASMTVYDAYIDVARRLSVLLSLLSRNGECSVLESHPHLVPDVSRVVYSFTVLFHPILLNMISIDDLRFLTLLYHFYRMINRLLPEKECWWAVRRAQYSERLLEQKLWSTNDAY
jgi:Fungal specific transcription factor domain